MTAAFEEPTIPSISPRVQRLLLAGWISLGVHAALIALVQVAPPATSHPAELVIEARLASQQAAPPAAAPPPPAPAPAVDTPDTPPAERPLLMPSETADALPVAKPEVAPPVQAAPPVEASPSQIVPSPANAPTETAPQSAPVVTPDPAAITSAVDLTYYSARDVDVHPRALVEVVPDYPADADRQRLSGKVRLQLKLEADGRVSDIEVVSATPPGLFEESARRAFSAARFSPAKKNGRPVRALVLIEVVFDWDGRPR